MTNGCSAGNPPCNKSFLAAGSSQLKYAGWDSDPPASKLNASVVLPTCRGPPTKTIFSAKSATMAGFMDRSICIPCGF